MTFDQVLDRLRGWVGEEVFIIVEEDECSTNLVYVRGILHPPEELFVEEQRGSEEEQHEFDVGVARETSIDLWRAIFGGAEGDDRRVRIRCGSAVIHIRTDVS